MPRIASACTRSLLALLAAAAVSVGLPLASADAAAKSTLKVSTSVTRNGSKALAGATVSKSVAIFLSTTQRASSAEFYIDNAKLTGRPVRTDLGPEFDLAGTASNRQAVGYDTTKLSNGSHLVSARLRLPAGRTEVVHATFTVANKVAAPAPAPQAASNDTQQRPVTRFPDATNTGVPPGTVLTPMSGYIILSTPGMVFAGKDVDGCIMIRADNVTIRNSRIRCQQAWAIRSEDSTRNLLVEDVEITGGEHPAAEGIAIGWSNFTLRRANIHDISDGPRLHNNVLVEDSYIHDLSTCGAACHNDGIQSTGGSNMVIRHNNIQNPHKQTSAILLGEALGPLDGALIENNLLNGGNYTLYLGQGLTNPNVVVRGNFFGRDQVYGLLRTSAGAKVVWNANVWADTGVALTWPKQEVGQAAGPVG